MAATLELARREDIVAPGSDVSSISLLSSTDGFDLDYRAGWTPAVASGLNPGYLQEAMTLKSTGDDQDDLASNRQALDDKLKETGWYWDDPTERYGVWLRAQLEDETYARQALIRRGNAQWGDSPFGLFVDDCSIDRFCTLSLERLPWWEATNASVFAGGSLDFGGEARGMTASIGDVPGRIARTSISPSTGDLDEFWLGFRTSRFGDRTQFEPVWECDDGTVYANTGTTEQANYMECDFSNGDPDGDAMQSRFYIKTSDVTATNYEEQRGQFIVLMRAQITSTTTCRVRLLDGYASSDAELRRQDRVTIEDTDWRLYALGTVQIPPMNTRGTIYDYTLQSYRLCLQAERVSGTGNLRCDNFILIPIGESAIYVSDASISSNESGRICIAPEETIHGYVYNSGNITGTMTVRPQGPYGYVFPVAASYIVFAGQSTGAHVKTTTATIGFNHILPRWRTLRGGDI